MRIGLVSTLAAPVARDGGGSVEQLVWLLTRELMQLGHEVTVFACEGSEVDGELVATLPGPYGSSGSPYDWQFCEWLNLCRAVEQSHRFDVLHSHSYLNGLPLEGLSRAPMLHTLHVLPHEVGADIVAMAPDAAITALSEAQWSEFPGVSPTAIIPSGLDPSVFPFSPEPEGYVGWFGRPIRGKNPLGAIQVAREMGLPLLMAGPHNGIYHEVVAPHIDGKMVEHLGFLDPVRRAAFLGGARALIYPFLEGEPFPLVLAETMMCGTPVVATRLGAAPEMIEDGVTGYLADDVWEMPALVQQAFSLDRERIRAKALARFSGTRMAESYLAVYEQLITTRDLSRRKVTTP